MHNVRKKKTTEEQELKRREKESIQIRNYNHLIDQCRKNRAIANHDESAMKLVSRILAWNPEGYTIWNYRREILTDMFKSMGDEEVQTLLENELIFVMERLKEYPKVYWIWNHRRWCLEQSPEPNWGMELGLVSKMLEYDARNYHGWHYRRYVIANMESTSDESKVRQEFGYTTAKINANFSNFSAWHNRSKLLPLFIKESKDAKAQDIWHEELDYVRQGLYTDPDDQSCWIYHHWLLTQHRDFLLNQCPIKDLIRIVQREIQSIEELYQVEPDNKWCMLSLVHYYQYLNKIQNSEDKHDEMRKILGKLQQVDSMRAKRYNHLLSQLSVDS